MKNTSPFPISGQLFFRDSGLAPTKDGRKLVMVVGVVAVPENKESWPFKAEHQYVVVGKNGEHSLTILENTAKDLEDFASCKSIGALIKDPIWRC